MDCERASKLIERGHLDGAAHEQRVIASARTDHPRTGLMERRKQFLRGGVRHR